MISTLLLASLLTFPVLSMGISSVESNHNFLVRGKAGEIGAFQVMPKYWGKVPHGFIEQAKQHDQIIIKLLGSSDFNITKAVMSYNGRGMKTTIYLRQVRRSAFCWHLIGMG